MFLLPLIIFLPFLEIVGFVVIGGRIGLGWSLLWLLADVIAGLMLLRTMGGRRRRAEQNPADPDAAALEDMFDGVCRVAGALLLIFPGFVSDFLAIPLLVPPLRRLLFLYLKRHDGVLHNINATSQSFTYWHFTDGNPRETPPPKTIDGEFRNTGDEKKLQ
ncbi:MAG: FxsA family protein [Alphaproteobacteria bacterium]|nr:FxsA family protein [Alphaproteobacteria bacterium]